MPVTKEFVQQYAQILWEHKVRTTTHHDIVEIVIRNKRIDVKQMFTDSELERLDKHYVNALVYAFARDNQHLFVKE